MVAGPNALNFHVEAIDVSNDVIKRFPTYPSIRKDVLEVAMRSLRP